MRGVPFTRSALYASRSGGGPLVLGGVGLDVEADVVEDEGLLVLGEDRFGKGPPLLLRQLVEDRAQGDRGDELERAGRLNRLRLQPAAHAGEAGGVQALFGLLRRGEVPEPFRLAQVLRVLRV